jgi:hypothetical protein
MSRIFVVLMIVLDLAGAADTAFAGGLDGTTPVVCAINEAFDCASGGQCVANSPEAINLPRLIRLDFAAKKAFAKQANGEERASPIALQESQEGELILGGIQNDFAWSMAISQESGDMSLTIAGGGGGYVVVGSCMAM